MAALIGCSIGSARHNAQLRTLHSRMVRKALSDEVPR